LMYPGNRTTSEKFINLIRSDGEYGYIWYQQDGQIAQ
jgi:hypothetical protein